MKYSNQKPEIYDTLHEAFGVEWNQGIIITYGDTVYCKYPLDTDKEVHEQVHIDQQAFYGVTEWWDRYLEDPQFRFEQELEAYKAEAEFVRKHMPDRNKRVQLIHRMCKDLSSSNYGNVCTFSEAKKLL